MISEVHGCDVEQVELKFRIEDFDTAFRVASGPFQLEAGLLQANVIRSKQVLRCGLREFEVGVAWGLDADLNVTEDSFLSLYVKQITRNADRRAAMQLILTNSDARKTIAHDFPMKSWKSNIWGRIEKPFACNGGGDVKLQALLRPLSGFLQNGALIAIYKIQVPVSSSQLINESQADTQRLQALSAHFEKLFDTGHHADVTLQIGSDIIEAHCTILSARSPVFDAMLSHAMAEKRTRCVSIDDLDVEAVRTMVKFMYTGKLFVDLQNDTVTLSLLKAAHRYQVMDLVQACIRALSTNLTAALALDRLMVADFLGIADLKSTCLDFITASSDRMVAIKTLPSFVELIKTRPLLMSELWSAAFPGAEATEPAPKRLRTLTGLEDIS